MFEAALGTHHNRSASFPVDPVVPADNPLWTETLSIHLAKRFHRKLLLTPDAEKRVVNALVDEVLQGKLPEDLRTRMVNHAVSKCHPVIGAVGTAFSQHRPLTLSPDCIWMVIEQSFAHHVTERSESLRKSLVQHEGRRVLSVDVLELSLCGFEEAISGLSSQIREATDPVLHETLLCDFSTTTPAIRTASEVVLMDCYASYFEYSMHCVCGIPKVTVLGSADDWRRMRARIEVFETFGLTGWVARLRPILDEFIRTVEGNPSLEFWQAIYKPKKAYGAECVTGWIADLFLYLNDPPDRRLNHIFEHERRDWIIPVAGGVETRFVLGEPGAEKGVAQNSFPSGLSSVPVTLTNPRGVALKVDMVAGFFAVEQDLTDLALSPVISWSVTERAPKTPVRV